MRCVDGGHSKCKGWERNKLGMVQGHSKENYCGQSGLSPRDMVEQRGSHGFMMALSAMVRILNFILTYKCKGKP